MKLQVKLFARARDLAGTDTADVELPEGATVGTLRCVLSERFPPLRALAPSLLVALDTDYADDDRTIPAGAEVACFPPVSGG